MMTTFDMFIDQFAQLDVEDQKTLVEILKHQAVERRRAQILAEGEKVKADIASGKKFMSIDDLLKD